MRLHMEQRTLGAASRCRPSASAAWACRSSTASTDEQESIATIHRALDLGVTMLDTADVYGPHTNEALVGPGARRDAATGVIIATKFGIVRIGRPGVPGRQRPARVRARELRGVAAPPGIDAIDLYYQHRVDPDTPDRRYGRGDGRPRARGQSAVHRPVRGGRRRRCAARHAVHPIAALQSEYSLWTRDRRTACSPRAASSASAWSPMPARPRVPDRPHPQRERSRAGRLPAQHAALPGRAPAEESRARRRRRRDRAREGLHPRTARACMGSRPGPRHRRPSSAPSGALTLKRTSARSTCTSMPRTSRGSTQPRRVALDPAIGTRAAAMTLIDR